VAKSEMLADAAATTTATTTAITTSKKRKVDESDITSTSAFLIHRHIIDQYLFQSTQLQRRYNYHR
jgi:hypothetical protein